MSENSSPFNHPDQPVRHSYPLAIEKAGFWMAWTLLMKTLPYTLTRFVILVCVSVVSILWLGATFGGGIFLGAKVHPFVGYGWIFAGLGASGYVYQFILRYMLYLIKAGHIAVLTELITKNSIGNGDQGMFQYGKNIVTERFAEVNVLFGVDVLIAGVVKAFNRTLDWIARLIPIPGFENVTKFVNAIVRAMTTYIDETIFSYNLARGDANPWRSGKDGLIYYAQNCKEIIKTSIGIVILDKVLTVLIWALFLVPAYFVARMMPGSSVLPWAFGIAALFAWNVRAAFLHPVFLIMIMTKFHVCVRGQSIDLAWDAKLSQLSGKFDQIKKGAAEWTAQHGDPSSPAPLTSAAPLPPPPPPPSAPGI